ncbi:MAG: peptidoglycan editing factor PgeF [Marinilabiliales bacterium]
MIKQFYNNLPVYKFKLFENHPEIIHFITTRKNNDGKDFSFASEDKNPEYENNIKLLSSIFNIDANNFVVLKQVHGSEILHIRNEIDKTNIFNKDAMITQLENICLCIKGADCVPLLLYAPETGTIAAAHAGWRGTFSEIVKKVIKSMLIDYNINIKNLIAGIGPSISVKNYEVDKTLANRFAEKFDDSVIQTRNGKYYLDLWQCNHNQITAMGVPAKNIEISGLCTFENSRDFYSYRRDKNNSGRFLSCLCLSSKKV